MSRTTDNLIDHQNRSLDDMFWDTMASDGFEEAWSEFIKEGRKRLNHIN